MRNFISRDEVIVQFMVLSVLSAHPCFLILSEVHSHKDALINGLHSNMHLTVFNNSPVSTQVSPRITIAPT